MRFFGLISLLSLLLTTLSAQAQNQLTYEGQLTDDGGLSVPDDAYTLRFQVKSNDTNDCLLFEETKNIHTTAGQFIAHLNDGTGTISPTSLPLADLFTSNTLTVPAANCANGSSPSSQERKLRISLNVLGSWVDLGDVALTTSPFAFRAHRIGPFTESQLLRTDMGVSAPQLDASQVSVLTALLSGTYSGNAASATTCSSLSGVLPVSSGGTGGTTAATALNNLLPSQAGNSGKVLQTDGSTAQWITPATGGTGITALTGDVTASGTGSVAATLASNAVTSAKIADGTILATDLNFTGLNGATSGLVLKDSSGKFSPFACGVPGQAPVWTAAGFSCQIPAVAEVDPKIGSSVINSIPRWNGSNLTDSPLFENGGNVGIGTNAPSSSLHLYNDSSNAVLLVESAASPTKDARAHFRQLSSEGTIGFVQSGGGFVVGSVSPTPFLLYANSTEGMRITPTGNIGIGTISPTEKLEVSGKVKAQELCLGADCRAAWTVPLATTAALDLYVSPGGSDSNPGTMSLPFMTIQKALETVPQKVLHPVTINIMSGTYSPVSAPSGFRDSWILIAKDIHYQSGGFLSLVGSGAQIMNANGWAIGITIARSSQGVRLEGLSVSNFNRSQIVVDGGIALMGQSPGGTLTLNSSPLSERALEVTNGGQANLDNFSASGFRNSGISIDEGSSVRIESGTSTLNMPSTPNYVSAVDIGRGGQFEIEGGSFNITALSSPSGGAAAFGVRGGSLRLRGGGLALNGVGLTTTVIRAEQGASVSVEATPSWTGVAQTFMTCSQNSSCVLGSNDVGTMTLMMMGANLLFDLSDQSSLRLTQPVQIGSGMSSVQTWFSLNNQSTLLFERAFTNSSSLTGAAFVRARNGSTVQLRDVFTASSGQPGTWFDLANHSRIHALMNVSLTSASQTNENPMSFTENSSGLFEQNLTVATSSASGASLFLQGNSSVVVRQTASLTTNAWGTSALRLEQNSTAEFQGAFSATGSGSDLRLVSANSGSSLRFKPLSASTNIWVSCSGGSSNVGFDVNNRSSIVFEGPSGRFTTNNIQGGCTTAAQIKNHSRFELSAGMISLTPLNGTISVSRLSTFSKGGTSQVLIAPACSLDSLCD